MTRQPEPPVTRRDRRRVEREERFPRERARTPRRPARPPFWRSPFALVSVGALLVVAAVIFLNQKPGASSGNGLIIPPTSWAASVTDGETAGKADAPVTLDIYADYQCPICGRFAREQLAGLKTGFVDTGVLRIVAKDIAILGTGSRNESLELAVGARCAADQGKYWAFHDLVYWNQQGENLGEYTPDLIASFAKGAGVDQATWETCIAGNAARATVKADSAAALTAGIQSTPTVSLNGGTPVPGLPNAEALKNSIRALAAAASSSPAASSAAP